METYIRAPYLCNAYPEKLHEMDGYRILRPEGYTEWIDKDYFLKNYRAVDRHERQLLNQTTAEA